MTKRSFQIFRATVALPLLLVSAARGGAGVTLVGTGVSPFAGCTADFPELQPGELVPDSEVEPFLAVNPTNPKNLVAVWQQDRWTTLSSRGQVVGTSFDGGLSWTVVTATKNSFCTGGTLDNHGWSFRSNTPWLSFASNGDLYLVSAATRGFDLSATLVAKSSDGGLTWSDPVEVSVDAGTNVVTDKNTITADPLGSLFVYAVWRRAVAPVDNSAQPAYENATAYRGPLMFSRTTDGGATWEAARELFDPGALADTVGAEVLVVPGGDLVAVFDADYANKNAHGLRGRNIAAMRSSDRGETWSRVTFGPKMLPTAALDPLTGNTIRAALRVPHFALDPLRGTIYAAWQDRRFGDGTYNEIAFAISEDAGRTWSEPVKVNQTPAVIPAGNRLAFVPEVHADADGSVAISYYDLRNNGTDSTANEPLETDFFLVRCNAPAKADPDGCADPAGWEETRLTPTSFNLRQAPDTGGLFLGDYTGLASINGEYLTLFAQPNGPTDPASIYFSRGL